MSRASSAGQENAGEEAPCLLMTRREAGAGGDPQNHEQKRREGNLSEALHSPPEGRMEGLQGSVYAKWAEQSRLGAGGGTVI